MTAPATPAARPRRPGGLPLTLGLVALILIWLTTPVVFLYFLSSIGPDSGQDPTLSQLHQAGVLTLSCMMFGELAPLAGLITAWSTRRAVLAAINAILFVLANVALIGVGAPPWELIATAVDSIGADSVPWTTP